MKERGWRPLFDIINLSGLFDFVQLCACASLTKINKGKRAMGRWVEKEMRTKENWSRAQETTDTVLQRPCRLALVHGRMVILKPCRPSIKMPPFSSLVGR